jgi:hypothetical protein
MVQLPAKVGEGLGVVRFGPERSRNSLTRKGGSPRVKDQKGNEFLLTGTRSAAGKATVGEYAEASEELEA